MPDTSAYGRRDFIARAAAIAGGAALIGAADLTLGARSAHAAAAPRVYTRAEWGARPPTSAAEIIAAPDHLVVHHMAFPNSTDYSLTHAFQLSRDCQDLHMDTNGWADTGQQLTISRGGYVMEGRNRSLEAIGKGANVMGAQTANNNGHTLGIENEGTYISVLPPAALWNALVKTLAWLCDDYGLDPHASIVGHRDYVATQCPGDALYAQLPKLRNDVANALGASLTAERATPYVRTDLPAPARSGDHGPAVGPREHS